MLIEYTKRQLVVVRTIWHASTEWWESCLFWRDHFAKTYGHLSLASHLVQLYYHDKHGIFEGGGDYCMMIDS